LEVLKKPGINPEVDNVIDLLDAAAFSRKPEVVEYLLSFNPAQILLAKMEKQSWTPILRSLGWDLDPIFMRRDPDPTIRCIEIFAKSGARWQPKEQ
jgi:hypothetical protein